MFPPFLNIISSEWDHIGYKGREQMWSDGEVNGVEIDDVKDTKDTLKRKLKIPDTSAK